MPIREYVCGDCGKTFEVLERKPGLVPVRECPSCGSSKVEQRLSAFAAQVGTGGGCGTAPGGG